MRPPKARARVFDALNSMARISQVTVCRPLLNRMRSGRTCFARPAMEGLVAQRSGVPGRRMAELGQSKKAGSSSDETIKRRFDKRKASLFQKAFARFSPASQIER
jgi:transposase